MPRLVRGPGGRAHESLGRQRRLLRCPRNPARFRSPDLPRDDRPGASPVAVIGFDLWRTRFGASTDLTGKRLKINGTTFTIVGVAPRAFSGIDLGDSSSLWVPFSRFVELIPWGAGLSVRSLERILERGRAARERVHPRERAGRIGRHRVSTRSRTLRPLSRRRRQHMGGTLAASSADPLFELARTDPALPVARHRRGARPVDGLPERCGPPRGASRARSAADRPSPGARGAPSPASPHPLPRDRDLCLLRNRGGASRRSCRRQGAGSSGASGAAASPDGPECSLAAGTGRNDSGRPRRDAARQPGPAAQRVPRRPDAHLEGKHRVRRHRSPSAPAPASLRRLAGGDHGRSARGLRSLSSNPSPHVCRGSRRRHGAGRRRHRRSGTGEGMDGPRAPPSSARILEEVQRLGVTRVAALAEHHAALHLSVERAHRRRGPRDQARDGEPRLLRRPAHSPAARSRLRPRRPKGRPRRRYRQSGVRRRLLARRGFARKAAPGLQSCRGIPSRSSESPRTRRTRIC